MVFRRKDPHVCVYAHVYVHVDVYAYVVFGPRLGAGGLDFLAWNAWIFEGLRGQSGESRCSRV